MIDFSNCILSISARSPFARRVRLAFLEAGVPFEQKTFDVLNPTAELIAGNLLARVPSVQFASGEILVDSNMILREFSENFPGVLMPQAEDQRLRVYLWMGLATGMCDKAVEYFLETIRPKANQDAEVLSEILGIQNRFLELLESEISPVRDFICGDRITQADLDIGCALAYLSLRIGPSWTGLFPKTFRYFEKLDLRPSFQKTRPPA